MKKILEENWCFRPEMTDFNNYVKFVEEVTSGLTEMVARRDKKTLESCHLYCLEMSYFRVIILLGVIF